MCSIRACAEGIRTQCPDIRKDQRFQIIRHDRRRFSRFHAVDLQISKVRSRLRCTAGKCLVLALNAFCDDQLLNRGHDTGIHPVIVICCQPAGDNLQLCHRIRSCLGDSVCQIGRANCFTAVHLYCHIGDLLEDRVQGNI